jgi:hypothetical protein
MFVLEGVNVKTVEVNMSLNAVNYPNDLRRLIRLGVKQENGHLYTLNADDELVLEENFACEPTNVPDSDTLIAMPKYRGGFSHLGSYKKDDKNRRIIFAPNTRLSEVTFEYIGSGVEAGEVTYIPAIATEAILAFMVWKSSGSLSQGQRLENKQEYNNEVIKLRDARRPSYDEILDSLRQGMSINPMRA